jgi:hypothetical protein
VGAGARFRGGDRDGPGLAAGPLNRFFNSNAMNTLSQHQKERNLISIRRDAIDTNSIQGFVLASSAELVVLQYVYDFNLDGLMVLRVADITDVRWSATGRFQKGLLERAGLVQRVPFGATFDLRNWRAIIDQLSNEYKLMVVECEADEENIFLIGRVLKSTAASVQIQEFSGAANWEEIPAKARFKNITSCQVGTNYINFYRRYFDENPSL